MGDLEYSAIAAKAGQVVGGFGPVVWVLLGFLVLFWMATLAIGLMRGTGRGRSEVVGAATYLAGALTVGTGPAGPAPAGAARRRGSASAVGKRRRDGGAPSGVRRVAPKGGDGGSLNDTMAYKTLKAANRAAQEDHYITGRGSVRWVYGDPGTNRPPADRGGSSDKPHSN